MPFRAIALELGRTEQSIKAKFKSVKWEDSPYVRDDQRVDVAVSEAEKAKKREQAARYLDRQHGNRKYGSQIIADRLEAAVRTLPEVRVEKPSRQPSNSSTPEDAMLLLSDIHVGAEHSLEETGGLSEFNSEVLKQYTANLKYAVKEIVDLHSQLYAIPKLHVACLGDIVAGMNDAGSWSSNYISMTVMDQMFEGVHLLSEMLAYWLGVFDEIVFYGIRGNHGRCARRGVEKDYVNWDYMCYRYLVMQFAENPRIRFVVPQSWWIYEDILNHGFLMVHGDDVRSKGGVPAKGLIDFEQKMAGIIRKNPDYTLAGHFHNSAEISTNHGRVLVNGSFVGSDVYSMQSIHAASRPEQTFFGIHPRRGITWKYNIDLADPRL